MNRSQVMLAIYAFLVSGLLFYGYAKRNRYLDVLLAAIGVAIVGVSLALQGFGVAAAISRALFSIGTLLAVAVAVLLVVRLVSTAYKSAQKTEFEKKAKEKTEKEKEPPKRDKAA